MPWGWFPDVATYLLIIGALCAGLAASYGREREANRTPTRQWWVNRVLILPLLAIAATAATEAFSLSPSVAAFSAAMLSLGGYDALCLLETRWKTRLKAVPEPAEGCGDAPTTTNPPQP
jgi:hypothetical protein